MAIFFRKADILAVVSLILLVRIKVAGDIQAGIRLKCALMGSFVNFFAFALFKYVLRFSFLINRARRDHICYYLSDFAARGSLSQQNIFGNGKTFTS